MAKLTLGPWFEDLTRVPCSDARAWQLRLRAATRDGDLRVLVEAPLLCAWWSARGGWIPGAREQD